MLKRREDYWGEDLPITHGLYNFDEIRYDFYRDANTLFEAFKTRLYDYRLEGDASRWATGYDFPAVRDGTNRAGNPADPLTQRHERFRFQHAPTSIFSRCAGSRGSRLPVRFRLGKSQSVFRPASRVRTAISPGSDLSSTGRPPTPREQAIARPLCRVPSTPRSLPGNGRRPPPMDPGGIAITARQALAFWQKPGWELDGGTFSAITETGKPFTVRNAGQFAPAGATWRSTSPNSLTRIGVRARVRLVDDVQYWRRLSGFDFDMVQASWSASTSPGNEQRNRWSSAAAQRDGSSELRRSFSRRPSTG